MSWDDMRQINRPIKLYWAGWESDTFRLGSMGWQISAEQAINVNKIRLAIRHPKAGVEGITDIEPFDYYSVLEGIVPSSQTQLKFTYGLREAIAFQYLDPYEQEGFKPIDWRPSLAQAKIASLQDLAHFTTVEPASNEVFLKEASMNEILEMALLKQEPEQARIREEMLRNEEIKRHRLGQLHTELRLVA